jgi:hypothetical protein
MYCLHPIDSTSTIDLRLFFLRDLPESVKTILFREMLFFHLWGVPPTTRTQHRVTITPPTTPTISLAAIPSFLVNRPKGKHTHPSFPPSLRAINENMLPP